MGKLIVTAQLTVDGVIDSVGEWVDPGGDHGQLSFDLHKNSAGMVMGRKTYEGLAGYWPNQPDSDPWAAMINPMPKYVGSTTLEGPLEWNATLIEGDLAKSLGEIKQQADADLYLQGCGEFAYNVAEAGLADEFLFFVNPLTWGQGVHLFGDRGPIRMELADVTRFDSGVVGLSYRPAS
jgi:dihydrofolate reductase